MQWCLRLTDILMLWYILYYYEIYNAVLASKNIKTKSFISCNIYRLETKKTTTTGSKYSTNANTATSATKIEMNSSLPQNIVASGQIRSVLHQSLLQYTFIMVLVLSMQYEYGNVLV